MWALSVFMQGVLNYRFQSAAGNEQLPVIADLVIPYYSMSFSPSVPPNPVPANSGNAWVLTQISSSTIPFSAVSCLLSSSGSSTLLQFSSDVVNFMAAAYPVGWPIASGAWPGNAGGTLIAGGADPFSNYPWVTLRSNQFPLANSGIFAIVDDVNFLPANAIAINYSSPSSAKVETGFHTSCSFWQPPPGSDILHIARTRSSWPGFSSMHGNGLVNRYNGFGTGSTQTRAIYQSPDPSGYVVRLCLEAGYDVSYANAITAGGPNLTATPGLSGSSGDFGPRVYTSITSSAYSANLHLHWPQWNNSYLTSPGFGQVGTLTAGDNPNVADIGFGGTHRVAKRFYAWGDDSTGTCVVLVSGSTNTSDFMMMFGLPEDETTPLLGSTIQRLFSMGQLVDGQGVDWRTGLQNGDAIMGFAYSADLRAGPIPCSMASYVPMADSHTNGQSSRFDVAAGDTPFLSGSELIDVDLMAGTWSSLFNLSTPDIFAFEPRRLGRVPIARQGRSTGQASWLPVGPDYSWFHTTNGFYMPWGGLLRNP